MGKILLFQGQLVQFNFSLKHTTYDINLHAVNKKLIIFQRIEINLFFFLFCFSFFSNDEKLKIKLIYW